MKRWSCSIEIEASSEDAARLRLLLPEFLRSVGYTTTSGTKTVEVAHLAATAKLKLQPELSGSRGQSDTLPIGRLRRRMGAGPNG